MATSSSIQKGTNPSGTHVATYSWSEDAVTKHGQRIILCDADGREIGVVDVASAPGTPVTVDGTADVIVAANTSRHGLILYNAGSVEVFFGFTSGVTSSNGIKIFPEGQFLLGGFGIYRGVVYGITASSSTTVRFQEW